MKQTPFCIAVCVLSIVVSGCKKDSASGGSGAVIPYAITAPKCLIAGFSQVQNGSTVTASMQYDASRRLIKITVAGLFEQNYAYVGNTIEITASDHQTVTGKQTVYLNDKGYASMEIDSPGQDTILYFYDAEGFLTKQYTAGSPDETRYRYEGGNRTQEWDFRVNPVTHAVLDSFLVTTTAYYNAPSGGFGAIEAWIERHGKPNANLEQTITGQSDVQYLKYDFDANGNIHTLYRASKPDYSDANTESYSWNCN